MEINEKLIKTFEGFENWREMIYQCGSEMITEGYITSEYLDSIIKSVEKYGPYFVVADRVAIAHSEIDLRYVKKMGVAWNIIENDSMIGDVNEKPLKFLLILSTTNGNEHMEFLKSFSKIFIDKKLNEKFYSIKNKKELLEFLSINF